MAAPLTRDLKGLAALFTTSGVLHLVRPQPFESITPRRLPARRGLVYASGVAEIACAQAQTSNHVLTRDCSAAGKERTPSP